VRNFLAVFLCKDFSKIWTAQILSQTASNMLTFSLILHMYEVTHSLTTISLVMIASTIPSVIFGPFSGVITDRVSYKKVLIYTNLLRFFVALLLIPVSQNTLAILEIIFLMSSITQFFAPAEMSSIPLIVKKENLVTANSIYITTSYGSLIFGYAIAGPLLGLVGSGWLFVIIASLYAVSAVSIWSMSHYDSKEVIKNLTVSNLANKINSVWSSTKEGLNYVRNQSKIFDSIIKLTVGWSMLGAFIVLLPGFAQSDVGIDTKLTGVILIAPAGVGMVFASYLLSKYKFWDKEKVIVSGFVICGFALLVFSMFRFYSNFNFSLLLAVILMIILGISAAFVYVSTQTLLHLYSDNKMRGRVFGLASMMINIALGLPALFVGGIADLTSPMFTLIILATTILIYSAILVFNEQ